MSTQVVVVGAGPVGLTLAVDLARRGVPLRIIDALARPTTESRAVAVHARTLELLDFLGIEGDLESTGFRTTATEFHTGSTLLARVPLDSVDSPFPFTVTTAQTETERVLTERLSALGVSVERGITFTGYDEHADGVTVSIRDAEGAEGAIECEWLVGTDGAHSSVRHATGQHLEGSFHGERFLMGDVEAEHPYDKHAIHIFFSQGDTTGIIFTMSETRLRLIVQIPEGADRDREATQDWLQGAVRERSMDVEITGSHWLTTFEIHHAQVPKYRVGRVLLAGDAAHVHSPAGGQGMNTGMQDAFNLSWKLAAVAAGAEPESLLDTYHEERHPVAAHVIRFSTALTRAGTVSSSLGRRLRNRVMLTAFALEPLQHRAADEIEEMRVDYRESSIVLGGGTDSLQAGDAARDVPGSGIWAALRDADPSRGHTVILVQSPHGEPTGFEIPDGVRAVELHEEDAASAAAAAATREKYGIERGGAIVVRPDGYIAAIVPRQHDSRWDEVVEYLSAVQPESVSRDATDSR